MSSSDASEKAAFFENSRGQNLFGVLHDCRNPVGAAVVFCHPLGEEKQKSYRPFVEFSRYLAANGVCSLRFDNAGFGDSDGDSVDATIESQILDTQDAIRHAKSSFECDRLYLVGLRFGATIVALTAERQSNIDGIALHSPIIDGADYWASLLRTQQFSALSRGTKAQSKQELLAQLEAEKVIEIDSQEFSIDMVTQLSSINLLDSIKDFNGRVLTTCVIDDQPARNEAEELQKKYQQVGAESDAWLSELREYWSTKSMYDSYSPVTTYQQVLSWLSGEKQ